MRTRALALSRTRPAARARHTFTQRLERERSPTAVFSRFTVPASMAWTVHLRNAVLDVTNKCAGV